MHGDNSSSGTIVRAAHNSRTGTRAALDVRTRAYTRANRMRDRLARTFAFISSLLQRLTRLAVTLSASLHRGGPNEFAETTRPWRILRYVVKGALEMNRSRGCNGSAGTFLEGRRRLDTAPGWRSPC